MKEDVVIGLSFLEVWEFTGSGYTLGDVYKVMLNQMYCSRSLTISVSGAEQ